MHPYPWHKNTTFSGLSGGFEALYAAPHRFSFNGQERTDEIAGTGNHNTALYWEYDTRLGRRWNVDPVDKPWMSPYHAYSNKPILNIDPNGANDGDYYTKDGMYLGSDGVDDDKAYVADGKNDDGTFKNAKELSVSHSVLLKFASAIHNESSGKLFESYSIASAFTNFIKVKNSKDVTLPTIVSQANSYSFGVSSEHFAEFMSDYNAGGGDSKCGISAAINTLIGGPDYSNGATLWDGGDLLHKAFQSGSKRSWGLGVDAVHGQGMNNFYQKKYGKNFVPLISVDNSECSYGLTSTARHGGTIFWKYYEGSTSHKKTDFLWMKFYKKPKF